MVRYFLFLTCVVQVTSGQLGDQLDPCPRYRGLPDGLNRVENIIKDRVLYKLDLRNAIRGYQPNKIYRLRVHTTSRKHKFNDASMILDPLDARCGFGRLIIDSGLLYSPNDCPHFVTTQQKQPMGRAHFKWQAPACGCVHIRIRVHANSSYFIEDEYTQNGPLARTICPEAGADVTTPSTIPVTPTSLPRVPHLSRTDRLVQLCNLSRHHPMDKFIKNQRFLDDRKLSFASEFEKERVMIALEQRQVETELCCNEDTMADCFGDVRRRRIDQYCGTGVPDVPFTTSRLDRVTQKESECCWQIGEARYDCFNYTIDKEQMIIDEPNNESHTLEDDLDEFDPANDIYDFLIGEEEEHEYPKSGEVDVREEEIEVENKFDTLPQVNDSSADADHQNKSQNRDDDKNVKNEPKRKEKKMLEDSAVGDVGDADFHKQGDADMDKQAISTKRPLMENDKILTPEECCFNGITAGTKVIEDGMDGCFKMADMFQRIFKNWNKTCDRKFVVCCFRVVEGMTRRSWMSSVAPRQGKDK